MKAARLASACLVFAVLSIASPLSAARPKEPPAPPTVKVDEALLGSLEWREVGPYRGGRVAAVAGLSNDPDTYYFGGTGGGVWKTVNGGRTWTNVSDGFFGGSIGAVAVSEWDPNVIYVGGGEATLRGNVSHGDGMWKSVDAGKTWKHVGLPESRHVFRIRIHPKNPDLVYVAAFGHAYGPNEERGVYRSKDGGLTWQRILYANPDAGACDLILDPTNPRTLYAAFWRARRLPWTFESGGEGSGLWKSTDGGDTWQELSKNPGLPKGTLGKIGIAVSPSNPENLYAIVEAEEGGVFRSKDGGKTWERTNESRDLRQRAWYNTRIYADPEDQEAVYVLNVRFHVSRDGGRSFKAIRVPHGDNHDLWIAPEDPLRMIESNDGGAVVSRDGGKTWTGQDNQPTAQMYRVSTDNDFPYRLLGGQQDNSALRIRSRSVVSFRGIGPGDWENTAGGESGHIVAKPDDPNVVIGGSYGGFLMLIDHDTAQVRSINPWPDDPMGHGAVDLKYRFQWNFPVLFSPHDPNLLYAGANVLFASRDLGASWQVISSDLTRNDKSKMEPSGGPITKDNTSVEYYGTVFAIAESAVAKGVLWTGSDDGLVHVSKDGGATWANVTPKGLPEWAQINSLEAHPFEAGGLYVAATRYKLDDFTPYLFRTTDYGATWTRIDSGIDRSHFTRVVRADPGRRGLLYAGTERGVWASFDDGASWQSLQRNLPIVPVTDLAVKNGDLVAATQGRSYWILDDLSPLHQVATDLASREAHLFTPRASLRFPGGAREQTPGFGKNPSNGVTFHYYLKEAPAKETEVKLEVLAEDGTVIRTYTRKPEQGEEEKDDEDERQGEDLRQVPAAKGMNRFVWNLFYEPIEELPGAILWGGGSSVVAKPGRYQGRLTVGGWTATAGFDLVPDPRSTATQADYEAQFALGTEIRDKVSQIHGQLKKVRDVRRQLDDLRKRWKGKEEAKALLEEAKGIEEKMKAAEEALIQTKSKSSQDPLNFPIRVNDKLAGLLDVVTTGDVAPTQQAYAVRDELFAVADAELAKLAAIWEQDLPAFDKKVREAGLALIGVE